MRRALFCGISVAVTSVSVTASAQHLQSPWDGAATAPTDAPYTCPAPPAFSKTLDVEGYYTDKQNSVIDAKRLAAFDKASAGPTHLGQYATSAADAWLSTGSRAAAACVYSLLTAAAHADAWDRKMPGVGVYLQNWMLSGTAVAYLKVRSSHIGTPAQDADVQRWFQRIAARVQEYFNLQRGHPGSDAWNNHMYWAGLAVAAQGIAGNDQEAFLWGMSAYRMGIDAIQPDGSLTAEMSRGQMALHYQLYALGPLIVLAELGEANGIDLYREKQGAIHRLVKFNIAAMKDPSTLATRTGATQKISRPYSGQEIGWAVPYIQRFPDPQLSAWIAQAPWVRFWQWGGTPPEVAATKAPVSVAESAFTIRLERSLRDAFARQFPASHPQSAAFFGQWCVEDNPAWRASIGDKGDSILLTNEDGDTSTGQSQGPSSILAPGWESVTGTLTPDHTQIDWSNGSYWTRCPSAIPHSQASLTGTWYTRGGAWPCSIQQQGDQLRISPGKGCKATGRIDATGHLATNWQGNRIGGVVTPDGNHINWDNQTYWTRAKVYLRRHN